MKLTYTIQATRVVHQLLPLLLSSTSSSSISDPSRGTVSSYIVESISAFMITYCGGVLNTIGSLVNVDMVKVIANIFIRGGTLDKALQQMIWLSGWTIGIIVVGLW